MAIQMMPLIILAIGIIFLTSYVILAETPSRKSIWLWHTVILFFSFLTLTLMMPTSPSTFLRAGLVNDGITNTLGLLVVLVCLFLQINRGAEKNEISSHTSVLSLCLAFFSLIAVQSNRLVFTMLSTIGMMLAAKGALLNEAPEEMRADHTYIMARRAFGYLVFSVLFISLCLLTFGETQFDQIQIHLARFRGNVFQIQIIEFMVIFAAMFVGELPPVLGVFSSSRKNTSWAMSVLFSALFALVALQIIIKLGFFIFTHVSIEATELEPQLDTQILLYIKWAVGIGLILTPFLALLQKNIKQSLLLFILNPFLQILMAASFGQREIINYGMGAIPQALLAMSILILSSKALQLTFETEIEEWVGIGRREPTEAITLIIALWALGGFPPFYGGLLVQKTLCINSPFTIFMAVNSALCGYYAVRLTALAFQKPFETKLKIQPLLKLEKLFLLGQVIALFLLGIFSQPLYKYGSYTIRHLFGDF